MMYAGIDILLATKHQKEMALREPFQAAFSANLIVPPDFDTDQFGTFTGEIPRKADAYQTVIAKARSAAEAYHYDYVIASEGSFGPHPALSFSPGDAEWLCFLDVNRDLVIVEFDLTTETNYSHLEIKESDDYRHFLNKVKFGSHGLILRGMPNSHILAKGVTSENELVELLELYFKSYSIIRLETDMRAMFNPTRMSFIQKLADKLIARMKSICEKCQLPGFGKISVSGKLRCADCYAETELYQSRVLSCVKCDHQLSMDRPDGLREADPQYCPYCNP